MEPPPSRVRDSTPTARALPVWGRGGGGRRERGGEGGGGGGREGGRGGGERGRKGRRISYFNGTDLQFHSYTMYMRVYITSLGSGFLATGH